MELFNEGGTKELREKNSATIYRTIANECLPRSVQMMEDPPGNHHDGILPILDTKMAVIGGQIVHHHFSKPMASLEITLKISAMNTSFMKISSPKHQLSGVLGWLEVILRNFFCVCYLDIEILT